MSAVGCGCGKKSGVKYEVTFADGSKQVYPSVGEAQAALTKSVEGGTFKAVAA